jgi:hypothetical protein|nr:MAG TPA: hypothetical protein [Caudoviricetes sp.]
MKKSVDQQAFDAIYKVSDALGYSTYVELPDAKEPYPFVVLGEVQIIPLATLSGMLGRVVATIDVWGTSDSRREVASMCQSLLVNSNYLAMQTIDASLDANASNFRILRDDSTESVLWHGVLSLEFNLRRK